MAAGRPFRRLAMVARWKPVHIGHQAVLDGLLEAASELWIGIGSSNKLDVHNPFDASETRAMLELVLPPAAPVVVADVPDLGDPPRWADMVAGQIRASVGEVDAFVTANVWVRSLLCSRFRVLHPVEFVAASRRNRVTGTMVRAAMARGEDWRPLVPPAVARMIEERGLDTRFRQDFGAATLALVSGT